MEGLWRRRSASVVSVQTFIYLIHLMHMYLYSTFHNKYNIYTRAALD